MTKIIEFLQCGRSAMRVIALLSALNLILILWKILDLIRMRARLSGAEMHACHQLDLSEATAREETTRVAKAKLICIRTGLRALELIATIAPLIGLLETLLGMV
ncbi:MAG: MotA/TolQ/ExbB proton channel family protein [Alphaproteobacteria bacterium]|nr:MotA/TolQ/ExbB proton channel family protein [Alphaproteobacteria bacterium]